MKNRIKELRDTLKISQTSFAEKISLSRSALCKIESGENNPSPQTIKLICREFGVDYMWLTTGEGEMFFDSDDDVLELIDQVMYCENEFHKRLFKIVARMSDDDLKALERIIDNASVILKEEL